MDRIKVLIKWTYRCFVFIKITQKRGSVQAPSTAAVRTPNAPLPGEPPCQQATSCRIMDLLEDARGNSFLVVNLDNSKSRVFLYSWFTRLMPHCLQQEKLLDNLADKLVPEWHFSEREAEPFPDMTQHQTSDRLQNLNHY